MKIRIRKFSFPDNGYLLPVLLWLCSCTGSPPAKEIETEGNVSHGIVFYEEGRFAGWPANHGIWAWGDEILVGFVAASHQEKSGHTYDVSTARDKYARSLDGGLTWTIEDAWEHGQKGWRFNNQLPDSLAVAPYDLPAGIDFTNSDLALTFLRATNNIGPSHFYYSYDRGQHWEGPFRLPDLETNGIATRTDYIVDGKDELTAFFTVAKSNDREGRIVCARTRDGGVNWVRVGWVGPEPAGFDIMSSSVRLGPEEMLTVIRTRTEARQDLITGYRTTDNGLTWERIQDPVADTGRGGSPPALVKLRDGRLALGYIYRSDYGSRVNVRFSADNGQTWSDEIVLRCGDGATRDSGYPRMVQRPDGRLVMVYYWNNARQQGAKPYRYIACTIFDPDVWK